MQGDADTFESHMRLVHAEDFGSLRKEYRGLGLFLSADKLVLLFNAQQKLYKQCGNLSVCCVVLLLAVER